MQEGFQFIGIDMTRDYVEIAASRIAHAADIISKTGEQS